MENSIRGVFTLLKDHNKTPHYFCQGLSEEQTFPLGQSRLAQHRKRFVLFPVSFTHSHRGAFLLPPLL